MSARPAGCVVYKLLMNEFVFVFAVRTFTAKKINLFVRFLVESTARQSAYGFIRPLKVISNKIWRFLQIIVAFSEYM